MRVFIAEKPSIGRTLAAALGNGSNHEGYIKGSDWAVTWCYGHLYELAYPEHYDKALKKWTLGVLPIIPREWLLLPKKSAKKQIGIIRKLLKNATLLVNAGDADREGQLLVDEVIHQLKWNKPVKRIILKDLSSAGVKKAITQLTPNKDYQHLSQSAEVRRRADWLMGINLSRLYTLRLSADCGDRVISIGRIQTPTLSLVVSRDRSIINFTPVPYYTVTVLICI